MFHLITLKYAVTYFTSYYHTDEAKTKSDSINDNLPLRLEFFRDISSRKALP